MKTMSKEAKPKSMKNILIVLAVLVVLLASLSVGTELAGKLSQEQEQKMEEIADLTKQEMQQLKEDFANLEIDEEAFHASAPEQKGIVRRFVDEIARWFGLASS